MTDTPPATVVIATYNRAEYIGAAIESVLGQTVPGVEVIVVDDGSTDHTRGIVEGFGRSVSYVYQDNAERAAARNRGLSLARSEYVAFLDSDDMLFPQAIEHELTVFRREPAAVVVFGDGVYITEDGTVLGRVRRRTHEGYVLERVVRRNFLLLGATLIRRDSFVAVGGFNEDRALSGSEDWEAWVRLAAVGPFRHVQTPILKYRVHSGSTVGNPWSMERSMLRARDLIFCNPELGGRLAPARPYAYAYVHLTLSNLFRAAGLTRMAWRHVMAAERSNRSAVLSSHFWGTVGRLLAGRRVVSALGTLKHWTRKRFDSVEAGG